MTSVELIRIIPKIWLVGGGSREGGGRGRTLVMRGGGRGRAGVAGGC